jgi:hypothetical protein
MQPKERLIAVLRMKQKGGFFDWEKTQKDVVSYITNIPTWTYDWYESSWAVYVEVLLLPIWDLVDKSILPNILSAWNVMSEFIWKIVQNPTVLYSAIGVFLGYGIINYAGVTGALGTPIDTFFVTSNQHLLTNFIHGLGGLCLFIYNSFGALSTGILGVFTQTNWLFGSVFWGGLSWYILLPLLSGILQYVKIYVYPKDGLKYLQAQLDQANTKLKETKEDLKKEEPFKKQKESKYEEMKKSVEWAQYDVDKYTKRLDDVVRRFKSNGTYSTILLEELTQLHAERMILHQQMEKMEQELEKIIEKETKIKSAMEQIETEISDLKNKKGTKMGKTAVHIPAKKRELQGKKIDLAEIEKERIQKEDEIQAKEGDLEEKDKKYDNIRREYNELEKNPADYEPVIERNLDKEDGQNALERFQYNQTKVVAAEAAAKANEKKETMRSKIWRRIFGSKNETEHTDEPVGAENPIMGGGSLLSAFFHDSSIDSLNDMSKEDMDDIRQENPDAFAMAIMSGYIQERNGKYEFVKNKFAEIRDPVLKMYHAVQAKDLVTGGSRGSPNAFEQLDDIMLTLSTASFVHTTGLHSIMRNNTEKKGGNKLPSNWSNGLHKEDMDWLRSKYPKEYKHARKLGLINHSGLTEDAKTMVLSNDPIRKMPKKR